MSQSSTARKRMQAALMHHADFNAGNTVVTVGDSIFTQYLRDGKNVLKYLDCWTGREQETVFDTEVEMCKFLGEMLSESDGPTEEYMRRFPAEFQQGEGKGEGLVADER